MNRYFKGISVPVLMGNGSISRAGPEFKEMGCSRILVLHDKNLSRLGLLDPLLKSLAESKLSYICFDEVEPDPPVEIVERAARLAEKEAVDGIAAIGGGSVIDTAKAVNLLLHHHGPLIQYFGSHHTEKEVPAIFIPTTAGTGSEVTDMAVVTVPEMGGEKKTLIGNACRASLAIVDADLMRGMPAGLTASTGMDAFAHAAEAITSALANPISDALAREAIRVISNYLPRACRNGQDTQAREQMAYGAVLAGMAFTNCRVHIGHAIGHVLGAVYHIPHGAACAAALPGVIRWSGKIVPDKVRMIGECMGCPLPDTEQPGIPVEAQIQRLMQAAGLSRIKLSVAPEQLAELLRLVKQQGAFSARPGEITDEDLAAILGDICTADGREG